MIIFIYIALIIMCVLGIALKSRNTIIQIAIIFIISYLAGRGANTLDTINYYISYQQAPFLSFMDTYEPGYLLLEKIGLFLNFDYIQFRIVLFFILLVILNKALKNITSKRVFFFYLFYSMYFIFIDTVQVRNFIAFSLVLYGLSFLIKKVDNKSIFKYVLYVMIASTIHISSLLYLVFLVLVLKNRKKIAAIIVSLSLIGCLFVFFEFININIVKNIISYISGGADRSSNYGESSVKLGFLIAFGLHIFSIFFMYLTVNNISKERKAHAINGSNDSFIIAKEHVAKTVSFINIIGIVYFPLYMFNLEFIRIARNIFMLNLIVYSLMFFKYRYINYQRSIIFSFTVILTILWFYYNFIYTELASEIITPFFDSYTI